MRVFDRNYSTKYRPELDLVLKDISMTIVGVLASEDFRFIDRYQRNRRRRLESVEGQALENHLLSLFWTSRHFIQYLHHT